MCKRKTILNDNKKIEVISIYENDGKNFADILTQAIKNIKIQKQMVIKYKKVKKGDFLNVW